MFMKINPFSVGSMSAHPWFVVTWLKRLLSPTVIFQGHMEAILCLQFDKRRIITGSADRTIR